jgi:hypothetical protein
MLVYAADKPHLAPMEMPARFKHDVAYFMTPPGEGGAPASLAAGEYWIARVDAMRWLSEGVLLVYSPLDSEKHAELEITQEQEEWLEWLVANDVERVRLVS